MRENINHYGAVRMRVQGSGNLQLTFYSQDDEISEDLVPIVMQPLTRIIPTRLAGFVNQRASLEVKVTELDEYFIINRILIYAVTIYQTIPE